MALLSMKQPKDYKEASWETHLLKSMGDVLNQIEKKETWKLFARPKDKNVIGTTWVFKNKLNEHGQLVRNKETLVCKGYANVDGVDFKETFAQFARLEAIRMFLAYACYKIFKVYQMDVKSAVLNGHLEEEVYIEQPKGFSLSENKDCM